MLADLAPQSHGNHELRPADIPEGAESDDEARRMIERQLLPVPVGESGKDGKDGKE
jgi:hypothetical protein